MSAWRASITRPRYVATLPWHGGRRRHSAARGPSFQVPLAFPSGTGQDHTVVIPRVVCGTGDWHRRPGTEPRSRLRRTSRAEGRKHHAQRQREHRPMVWQDYANCLGVDPDLFFPERGASTREAKEVCRGCVVREDCLEYALDERREVRHLGRHERARAPPHPPPAGARPPRRRLSRQPAPAGQPGLDRPVLGEVELGPRGPRSIASRTAAGTRPDQLGPVDPAPRRPPRS